LLARISRKTMPKNILRGFIASFQMDRELSQRDGPAFTTHLTANPQATAHPPHRLDLAALE